MNAALARDPVALRVNLTVPTTAVCLGPFAFNGLKALLGVDLADVLAPMMIGPKTQRPVLGGLVDAYPLAIRDGEGEGLTVPIKLMGKLGFYNLRSLLVLVVPPQPPTSSASSSRRKSSSARLPGRASGRVRAAGLWQSSR